MTATVPGLFGKLPAHGDFVRRGWCDETVDAVDRWLTGGIAAMRVTLDDEQFAARMHAAPLWQGYVAPGMLGPWAMHLAIAPSIDRAGRLFPIVAGVAGRDEAAIWARATGKSARMLDATIYDALTAAVDADALVDRLGTAEDVAAAPPATPLAAPDGTAWWTGVPGEESSIDALRVDDALLERLLG